MKVDKLFQLEEIVEGLLIKYPECKKCDMLLYYKYCEKVLEIKKGSFQSIDFLEVFRNKSFRAKYGISGYASIERVRRRIQSKNMENIDLETKEIRQGEKSAYIQYALCI